MNAGMRIAAVAAVAGTMAGCAKSPESIQASYVSPLRYQALNCSQLSVERANLENALARTSDQQRSARGADTVGVILIGLPVSTLSGSNVAGEVGRLKGEVEAVRQTQVAKGCSGGVASGGVVVPSGGVVVRN